MLWIYLSAAAALLGFLLRALRRRRSSVSSVSDDSEIWEYQEAPMSDKQRRDAAKIDAAKMDVDHYNAVASYWIQQKRAHRAELARLAKQIEICEAMRDGKREDAVEKQMEKLRKAILADDEHIFRARKRVVAASAVIGEEWDLA